MERVVLQLRRCPKLIKEQGRFLSPPHSKRRRPCKAILDRKCPFLQARMLIPHAKTAMDIYLQWACALQLYPFRYDPVEKRLGKIGWKRRCIYKIHKYCIYCITMYSGGKWIQAQFTYPYYPLNLNILTMVFFVAFIFTSLNLIQFEKNEDEILQYYNMLLKLMFGNGDFKRVSLGKKNKQKFAAAAAVAIATSKEGNEEVIIVPSNEGEEEKGGQTLEVATLEPGQVEEDILGKPFGYSTDQQLESQWSIIEKKWMTKVSLCFMFALTLLAGNPTVHVKLVQESPCNPSFLISSYLPCHTFPTDEEMGINFLHKIPWMIPEYYFTTLMFSSWSFNWVAIFLGMGWMAVTLRKLTFHIKNKKEVQAAQYRQVEVLSTLMNHAFKMYLATFPLILFFIVAILLFGVIRFGVGPQQNIMFPLCGVRCTFESVTPLEMVSQLNRRNKELMRHWKKDMPRRSKLERSYRRACCQSFNNVVCNSGSLFTFHDAIVLVSVNNCINLIVNFLVTFE